MRQAVYGRVTRLSNDELSGEEEAVMSVVHSLMSLLEVIQPNYNVRTWYYMCDDHIHSRYYYSNSTTLFFSCIPNRLLFWKCAASGAIIALERTSKFC